MPKSKEIVSSSGSESEEDDEPKQKKKKPEAKPKAKPSTSESKVAKSANKKAAKSDSDDEAKFELGKLRFATACEFRGRKMVNIREFYQADDGELRPGKKGIALSEDQWNKLKEHMDDIDKALENL